MNDKAEKAVNGTSSKAEGSVSGNAVQKPAHRINDSEETGQIRFDSSLPVPKGKLVTESYKGKSDGFKKTK